MSDPNVRCIGGNVGFRRFAYLHKKDHSKFGVLEAANQTDARKHLGKQYHIRYTWLTADEELDIGTNKARRWEIVSSIFLCPDSVDFVGVKNVNQNESLSLWVVEYSRAQKWFRVDELNQVVTKNAQLLLNKIFSDFVILFVGTQSECWGFCESFQQSFKGSDGKIPEVKPRESDTSESARLRKRIADLESQLEDLMQCTKIEIIDNDKKRNTRRNPQPETLAQLEGHQRNEDPAAGQRRASEK